MRFPWNKPAPRTVLLFGKPGCHLCEDARALLDRLRTQFPHTIEEVDIRANPQLFRQYDIRIPVLVIDGGPEIDAPLTEATVRAALQGRR